MICFMMFLEGCFVRWPEVSCDWQEEMSICWWKTICTSAFASKLLPSWMPVWMHAKPNQDTLWMFTMGLPTIWRWQYCCMVCLWQGSFQLCVQLHGRVKTRPLQSLPALLAGNSFNVMLLFFSFKILNINKGLWQSNLHYFSELRAIARNLLP